MNISIEKSGGSPVTTEGELVVKGIVLEKVEAIEREGDAVPIEKLNKLILTFTVQCLAYLMMTGLVLDNCC